MQKFSYKHLDFDNETIARWVILFDNYFMTSQWQYCHTTFHDTATGMNYCPTLNLKLSLFHFFLEVSEEQISTERLDMLKRFSRLMPEPLFLLIGSFASTPRISHIKEDTTIQIVTGQAKLVTEIPTFYKIDKAIEFARGWDFSRPAEAQLRDKENKRTTDFLMG